MFIKFTAMLEKHNGSHLQVAFLLGENNKILKFINNSKYKRTVIRELLTQKKSPDEVSLICQDLTKLKIFID